VVGILEDVLDCLETSSIATVALLRQTLGVPTTQGLYPLVLGGAGAGSLELECLGGYGNDEAKC
jgi:hypothetical protein